MKTSTLSALCLLFVDHGLAVRQADDGDLHAFTGLGVVEDGLHAVRDAAAQGKLNGGQGLRQNILGGTNVSDLLTLVLLNMRLMEEEDLTIITLYDPWEGLVLMGLLPALTISDLLLLLTLSFLSGAIRECLSCCVSS